MPVNSNREYKGTDALCIVCASRVLSQNSGKGLWPSWERSAKTISSRTGKMSRTGSAWSNSCPPIIQRLGSFPPTSSGTSLVMQISRTHAPWHSSAILTPALTSFYFPFRLLRRKTSSRLYVEFLFADHHGSDGASRGRSQPYIRLTALRFSQRWTQTQLRDSPMGN